MPIKTVYRGYVSFGHPDPAILKGNPVLRPTLIREQVFGDFVSEAEAVQAFSQYLNKFVKQNPKQQIPQFRLTEHKVDENNLDVFFYNSDNPILDGTPIQEIDPNRS